MRVLLCLLAFGNGCASIAAGQAGVLWRPFTGTDSDPLGEGLHVLAPAQILTIYDLRTQEHEEKFTVLAANGLAMGINLTIHYRVEPSAVASLHREVGPNYYDVLIGPLLRSRARRVIGRYTAEQIYSTKRDVIEEELVEAIESGLTGRHVSVDLVLIRNVQLPLVDDRGFERVIAEEQRALAMKYVIDRERLETNRKIIEAEGEAQYQDRIAAKLTDVLLRWKKAEALQRLAVSPSTRVMLFGSDKPTAATR